MGKLPGFTFYPGDWLKDPELLRCTKAEKGVWIDMLAVLWECADRGVFSTGGEPWTDREIAAAIGGDIAENLTCLRELLRKRVARRNSFGSVFSARMVRDETDRACTKTRVQNHRDKKKCNGIVTGVETSMYEYANEIEKDVALGSKEKEQDFENMHPASYAAKILETLVLPHTTDNLRVVAASIEAEVKAGKSPMSAYEFVLAGALDAKDEGIEITRFFFSDAKYRGNNRKRAQPGTKPHTITCRKCMDAGTSVEGEVCDCARGKQAAESRKVMATVNAKGKVVEK